MLSIVGYYSKSPGSFELRGSSQSLLELADILRAKAPTSEVLLTGRQGSMAHPYDDFLSSIRIKKNNRPMVIDRNGTSLEISGSKEALKALAENIELLARQTQETSTHVHVEYYPGHFFLSPSSVPLVVERDP